MTSSHSITAAAILRVLAVRLKVAKASPLIPMHISGDKNEISDIPSRSSAERLSGIVKTI